jgi:hypothetical protein
MKIKAGTIFDAILFSVLLCSSTSYASKLDQLYVVQRFPDDGVYEVHPAALWTSPRLPSVV